MDGTNTRGIILHDIRSIVLETSGMGMAALTCGVLEQWKGNSESLHQCHSV